MWLHVIASAAGLGQGDPAHGTHRLKPGLGGHALGRGSVLGENQPGNERKKTKVNFVYRRRWESEIGERRGLLPTYMPTLCWHRPCSPALGMCGLLGLPSSPGPALPRQAHCRWSGMLSPFCLSVFDVVQSNFSFQGEGCSCSHSPVDSPFYSATWCLFLCPLPLTF